MDDSGTGHAGRTFSGGSSLMNEILRAAQFTLEVLAAVAGSLLARPEESAAQQPRIGIELGATPAGMALERLNGPGGELDLAGSIGTRPVLLAFWAT